MNQVAQKKGENKLLSASIWRHFSKLKDPRVEDNPTYQFDHLIIAIVCAMICGANNIEAITNYIESKIDWLSGSLGLQKAPSYQTICWLLVLIDPVH